MDQRNNKRPPFAIFKTVTRTIRKDLKAHPEIIRDVSRSRANPKKLKTMTNVDLLKFAFHEFPNSSILSHLIVNETQWNDSGRHILFPGTADFFERLLDSKFTLSDGGGAGLSLPFKTFILSVPQGMTYRGYRIPSPLVSYSENFEDRQASFNRVRRLLDLTDETLAVEPEDERDTPKVTLFFHNPYDDDEATTSVCTMMTSEINQALAMDFDRIDDFREMVGQYEEDHFLGMESDDTDSVIQLLLMRLVAGLSVYLSATESKVLSDGLPDLRKFGVQGIDSHSKPTAREIPSPSATAGASESGIMTTRRWHFRNLRADRFYRGKYASLTPGSRWSIVKEAVVGRYKATTVDEAD